MQHNGLADLLPDALAEVLGRGVADCRREWANEVRLMGADHAKFVAELRAENLEYRAGLKEWVQNQVNDALEAQARRSEEIIETQAEQIQALTSQVKELTASIRDGRDGEPGPKGDPGPAGRDADPELVKEMVLEETTRQLPELIQRSVAAEVAKIPPPERGPPGEIGAPGRDADPAVIKQMVQEEVAQLPPPERGEKGDPGPEGVGLIHIKQIGDDLVFLKSDGTEQIFANIRGPAGEKGLVGERGEPGPQGIRGDKGDPGKDADPEMIRLEVEAAMASLPKPKDGEPGPAGPPGHDGKDADPEHVKALVEHATAQLPDFVRRSVADAVAELPKPKDGEKGDKGDPGRDADPEHVKALVEHAVAAMPKPKDGIGIARTKRIGNDLVLVMSDGGEHVVTDVKGPAGPRGETGEGLPGRDGRDGQPGVPGIGKDGQDGKDGRDGADGLGFEDFEPVWTGERELTLRWSRGDQIKEIVKRFPVPMYQETYKADQEYQRGDCTTWGGSMWIAMKATSDKPGTSDAWKLCVKRGQDGRDRSGT